MRTILVAALVLGAGVAGADDDLTLIKKAVADEAKPKLAPAALEKKAEPQWLKVRIQHKNGKGGRVSVNLPLAFVKAVGEDWPIGAHSALRSCGSSREGQCVRLGDALKALEGGKDIVTVENEDNEIRVWVE